MNFLKTEIGYFLPITSNVGLKELKWQKHPFSDYFFVSDLNQDVSRETIRQLDYYLLGSLKQFSIPFDFSNWSTKMTTWFQKLYQVPYGQTITYNELAYQWGNKKAARAAGQVCKRNPIPIILPCHRITNANTKTTHYSGRTITKSNLKENIYLKQWLIDLEKQYR